MSLFKLSTDYLGFFRIEIPRLVSQFRSLKKWLKLHKKPNSKTNF